MMIDVDEKYVKVVNAVRPLTVPRQKDKKKTINLGHKTLGSRV